MIMGYCYEFGYGVPEDEQVANGFYHLGEISNLFFDNYCLNIVLNLAPQIDLVTHMGC